MTRQLAKGGQNTVCASIGYNIKRIQNGSIKRPASSEGRNNCLTNELNADVLCSN